MFKRFLSHQVVNFRVRACKRPSYRTVVFTGWGLPLCAGSKVLSCVYCSIESMCVLFGLFHQQNLIPSVDMERNHYVSYHE